MAQKKVALESMSYEEAFSELEKIIHSLENETPTLAESMSLFERGQMLANHCASLLENAQLKVQQLSETHPSNEIPSSGSVPTE